MFKNLKILITGGTGTFGKAFITQSIKNDFFKKIYVLSRDELKQSQLNEHFKNSEKLAFLIGDVRDLARLKTAFRDVDIVIHAAAQKQVPSCEYNPTEAIKTNIYGSQNIIDAAVDCNVKKVLFLSTDKAVEPLNLYGTTKLCMEKLVTSSISYIGSQDIKLSIVRYGNVVGSRGSVINLFKKAKEEGKSLPVTHESMTRFWLTASQAVSFVLSSLNIMMGGEIFVPKLPSMNILDLVKAIDMQENYKTIGIRKGEKLHETLISKTENRRVFDCGYFYIIKPDYEFYNYVMPEKIKQFALVNNDFYYSSNNNTNWLSVEEMKDFIKRIDL